VTPATQPKLLDLFLLEKAAYEIRYEAANRPAWIGIPLSGMARLVERLLPQDVERKLPQDAQRLLPPDDKAGLTMDALAGQAE
jgi:hypothetical protein